MPLGLDLNPYSLRIADTHKNSWPGATHYCIQGIPPRWNEPIVWDDPQTIRYSKIEKPISLMDAWWKFNNNYHANIEFHKAAENDLVSNSAVDLVIEALTAHIPNRASEFVALAVDNLIPEFQQTELLRAMSRFGFGQRELLWRPVALALAHLREFESIPYEEGDRLVIVDMEACIPEITILTLKEWRDHLVPLRNYPTDKREPQAEPFDGFSIFNIINIFIEEKFKNDEVIKQQLRSGPCAPAFFSFLDSGEVDEIWIRRGLDHEKLKPKEDWRHYFSNIEINSDSFVSVLAKAERVQQESDASNVLYNGLLARMHAEDISNGEVMPAEAIAVGTAEYASRRLDGIPGYLDTLPGIEVLSRDEGAGTHNYYDVIPAGEVEGGKTVRIPEPLSQFSLEQGIDIFNVVLHNVAEDIFKRYETLLPAVDHDDHIPLIIRAEAQPGQGHALVTIEGAEGFENVFGEMRQVELDWESGTDFVPIIAGPEVYPVRGRIADDPECHSVAKQFVEHDLHVGSQVQFRQRYVGYMRVHEPWGYEDPFGNQLGEPTRALFGAMDEEDSEIWELANAIGQKIQDTVRNIWDRHKYLNYMFRFAPEGFREELRQLYSSKNPDLNWNTVYAVGRTFYKCDDFELFLDFILDKSKKTGFPNYPNEKFIPAYFWSFFRALCYYEDTAAVDRGKIEGVLECIYKYSKHCSNTRWHGGRKANVIKYLLCGILFSLRLRRHHGDFLAVSSVLYNRMYTAINDFMPRIDYPPTMFETAPPDKLNDYVLRFLDEEQTNEDMTALQGLVIALN